MELPSAFKERMKNMLGEEYEAFINSYDAERSQGLRLNLIKVKPEVFLDKTVFCLRQIAWAEEGFYYGEDERPGRHPWHEAGVYYIQEPSAMSVVTFLDPRPGECVLDLCAAPGGKSSHIASRMKNRGLIVSNEIHPVRAKILSQNVERMGIQNLVVTNENSARLAEFFPLFFDRIVVDAPCSGEGMFRKDEEAVRQWSEENVINCGKRQREILVNAAAMLKAGGRLVYSTCTFAPEENERTIEWLLETYPEFSVEETARYEGLSEGMPQWTDTKREDMAHTVRIWPHKSDGEGHYVAVLKKNCETRAVARKVPVYVRDKKLLKDYNIFCGETLKNPELFTERNEFVLFGDQLYLLPSQMICFDKLKVLRPGLHLGTLKKNRFEPSHALALSLNGDDVKLVSDFSAASSEIAAYLKGEAVADTLRNEYVSEVMRKGWALVTVDGYSLGWAKLSGGILKNHYPKGLRK